MISDETAYRRYLDGEQKAADLLVEKYGSALTLYINGYLKDMLEAEDLMIEAFHGSSRKSVPSRERELLRPICIKRREISPCAMGKSAGSAFCVLKNWTLSLRAMRRRTRRSIAVSDAASFMTPLRN